jgi:KDO2-lipid IV(A) lauroyltransferase
MIARFLYYLVVLPLSYLPLNILYLFTDVLFVLLITVFPYRSKVVSENLKRSFPAKSDPELNILRRKFYRHFCDLLAEGIKKAVCC